MKHALHCAIFRQDLARQSCATWQKAFLPGDATYLLGLIRDHKVRKRCFWHALAELRRLKLISEGRFPNPWKRS
jgi:hypothetical protein